MIAIIDYGIGNVASIKNMIQHVGGEVEITKEKEKIHRASGIILPGIGSFDACMVALRASNLLPSIEEQVFDKNLPILGICVGMQMMAHKSEEGKETGLGWFDAEVKRFQPGKSIKIPHMGWRDVCARSRSHLFKEEADRRFYFVHSYHMICHDAADIEALAEYNETFVASIAKKNMYGVQFHPEKSHRYGMSLFKSWLKIIELHQANQLA